MAGLSVCAQGQEHARQAQELAGQLGLPFMEDAAGCKVGALLVVGDEGISLSAGQLSMRADFSRLLRRLRPAALDHELLVRATRVRGVKEPVAVDATAGLGEDSLLLAAAGFSVIMYERNPVIATLLADALKRASQLPELASVIGRMELRHADSIRELPGLAPDVVLLDPMFPARTKSAQVKKKFQIMHLLEGPATDERELLDAALAARPRKVVVKRPPKGPLLCGVKPSYSLTGKAVRYDCLVPPRRTEA